MYARLAPNRMPLPPPSIAQKRTRAPAGRRATRMPSATAFVFKIVLSAIAIVMAAVVIATAPPTVLIPLATALVAGLAATALLIRGDRGLSERRRSRRGAPHNGSAGHDRGERGRDAPAGEGWGALAVGSAVLLLLALVASEGLRVALAATGLAGLAAFRLAAMYGGWMPRGSAVTERPAASETPAVNGGS